MCATLVSNAGIWVRSCRGPPFAPSGPAVLPVVTAALPGDSRAAYLSALASDPAPEGGRALSLPLGVGPPLLDAHHPRFHQLQAIEETCHPWLGAERHLLRLELVQAHGHLGHGLALDVRGRVRNDQVAAGR